MPNFLKMLICLIIKITSYDSTIKLIKFNVCKRLFNEISTQNLLRK